MTTSSHPLHGAERVFSRPPQDYARNQVIRELLEGVELESVRIFPCFQKKRFWKSFFARRRLVNDFFISDWDTLVNDRQTLDPEDRAAKKWFRVDRFNFHRSRYLLADTRAHLDYWTELFGPTKAECFVLPVLASRLYRAPAPPRAEGPVKVLFFGTFIPLQGIDRVLRALAIVDERGVPIDVELVGQGQTHAAMVELARELGIYSDELFNGTLLAEPELAGRIRSADLVLGVFGDSRKARCVVPNKVYQGLASGRCVITMDTPAVREVFQDGDLVLTSNEPDAIASAIERLVRHPEERRARAEKGRAAFERLYEDTRRRFAEFILEADRCVLKRS